MALTDPTNTLAYHTARPFTRSIDLTQVPCVDVVGRLKGYMPMPVHSTINPGTPEYSALAFYLGNQLMGELRSKFAPLQPLGDYLKDVEDYYSACNQEAIRAFYYLLLICLRESRHVHGSSTLWQRLAESNVGDACLAFNQLVATTSGDGLQIVNLFYGKPPNCTLGQLTKSLVTVFYKGKFGGGYGGPAWGAVADCLHSFVTGEYTGEMMMDTVWTLAHNNGPIFNKGMLYPSYSAALRYLLDLQRAGKLVEATLYGVSTAIDKHTTKPGINKLAHRIHALAPRKIAPYVDCFEVERLGATQNWYTQQVEQVKTYGVPAGLNPKQLAMVEQMAGVNLTPEQKQAAQKLKAKEMLKQAQAIELAALKEAKKLEIMPGLFVKKLTRADLKQAA